MLASIVRELRDQARLAVLGAVMLAVLLPAMLYAGQSRGLSLLDPTYQTAAFCGFASGGLAMGLALLLGDLRRGYFGYFVHRPMARWKLFVAKLIAGTLLYYAATTVALAAAAACAADSWFTHAPFDRRFLIPSMFAQLLGVLWLTAGMLIAARQARWVGSRLFPVAFAGFATFLTFLLAIQVYEAAAIVLTAAGLLAVAGAAYFAHNGDFAPQPLWAKPVSMVMVGGGAAAVIVIITMLCTEWFRLWSDQGRERHAYTSYLLADDGQVYVDEGGGDKPPSLRDLDGRPVPADRAIVIRHGGDRTVFVSYSFFPSPEASRQQRATAESFLNPDNYLQIIQDGSGRWTLVTARMTLERYNVYGRYTGTLAPDGTFGPARIPFPEPLRRTHAGLGSTFTLLAGPHRAYLVSPADGQVREAIRTPDAEPLISVTLADTRTPPAAPTSGDVRDYSIDGIAPFLRVVAITRDKTIVAPFGGAGPWQSVATPADVYNYRTITLLDDGFAVLRPRYTPSADYELITLRHGVETRRTLPMPDPWTPGEAWMDKAPALILPTAMLAVGLLTEPTPPPAWLVRLPLVGAAVAAGLTIRMARRRGFDRATTITWLTLAALLGVHAPLTLLCLRDRPVRVPCPACGRKRAVDRDRCPHCGAAWPTPADPATDVFADGRVAA